MREGYDAHSVDASQKSVTKDSYDVFLVQATLQEAILQHTQWTFP